MGGRTLHFYFPSAQLQISSPEPCGNNNSICFKDLSNFSLNNCLAGKARLSFLLCRIYIYSIGFIVDNVVFIAAGFMCRTHGPPGCYPAGRDSGEWGRLAQPGCLLLLWPRHTWYLFLYLNLYLHICFCIYICTCIFNCSSYGRLEQWYVTIASSDLWWITIKNHRTAWSKPP